MNQTPTGIQKILWHSDLVIDETKFDVLIPLPANHDQCLQNIGITDFDDADDQWDEDFDHILNQLIKAQNFHIEAYDPHSKKPEQKIPLKFSEIPTYLSQADHLNIELTSENKKITFTGGHQIFWLNGFSHSEIESLGYEIVKIQNEDLSKIY